MYTAIPLSNFRPGAVLSEPIFDASNPEMKLVGAGVEISTDLIVKLRMRGVSTAKVHHRDLAMLNACKPQGTAKTDPLDHDYVQSLLATPLTCELDDELELQEEDTLQQDGNSDSGRSAESSSYDATRMNQFSREHENAVSYMDGLFVELISGKASDVEGLHDVCRESCKLALEDGDLFACLGINPFSTEYPSRHSLHVATLAISMGQAWGMKQPALIELGIGCLLHDIGMLQLDERLYSGKSKLGPEDLAMVAKHPILALDTLKPHWERIPFRSRIVVYQMHERCNGSGYPRGRTSDFIHDFAKIAAVADTYVGLVSPRPHRPAMQSYYAMERMLQSVKQGLFDSKAVRALLRTVSLFPLGSYVATNDGRMGRVIRANGDRYDRPVVELWNPRSLDSPPDVVNLNDQPKLKINSPLAQLNLRC